MNTLYDHRFFDRQADGSLRSARIIVPAIIEVMNVGSVLDVGCGVGTWLRAFAENGIDDYFGVDGDYVSQDMLQIPPDRFKAVDLREPITFDRGFDLACSLEVAEHLPSSAAAALVTTLVKSAPAVLFSAAIPGQGGMSHINEQWQSYWFELFRGHGYEAYDCIRPRIYMNPGVEWWYKQNILLFCAQGAGPLGYTPTANTYDLDRVHPQVVHNLQNGPHSGKEAVTALGRGVKVIARKVLERLK